MKKMITMMLTAALAAGMSFGVYADETEYPMTELAESMEGNLLSIFQDVADLEEGSAGNTLDQAVIASRLLSMASLYGFLPDEDSSFGENTELVDTIVDALYWMEPKQIRTLEERYDGVGKLLDQAIDNYGKVEGLFEDAGVGDTMDNILSKLPDAPEYWETLRESIDEAFDRVYFEEAEDEEDTEEETENDFSDEDETEDDFSDEDETEDEFTDEDETEDDSTDEGYDTDEPDDEYDIDFDYGESALYTREDMDEAIEEIIDEFDGWDGCVLKSLSYAGDECNNSENLAWMNSLKPEEDFTECIKFVSVFHSPAATDEPTAWNPDTDYTDWEWWLARTDGGDWMLVTWGY